MSSIRRDLQEDPLSLFVSSAEAEDVSKRAKLATISISQKHAQTMSRIGAPPSDLFAESLSFGDPLSRLSPTIASPLKFVTADSQTTLQSQHQISSTNILDDKTPLLQSKLLHNNSTEVPSSTKFQPKEVQSSSLKMERAVEQAPIIPVVITSESSFRPEERSMRNHGFSANNSIEIGESDMKYLSGEMLISSVDDVKVQIAAGRSLSGILVLTNYRLKLLVSEKLLNSINSPSLFSFLNVPLGCIDRIEKEKKTKEQKSYEQKLFNSHCSNSINSHITILVTCKDMRILRITLPYNNIINGSNSNIYNSYDNNLYNNSNLLHGRGGMNNINENDIENFIQTIAEVAFPNDRRMLFAFAHTLDRGYDCKGNGTAKISDTHAEDIHFPDNNIEHIVSSNDIHSASSSVSLPSTIYIEPYCILKELKRLKVLDIFSVTEKPERTSLFRVSTINSNYNLCNTYPALLVVPKKMSDDELTQSANFRSGHRLPVLCWADSETGVTMWRSSQPKSGVSGASVADEKLLDLIAQSCVYKRTPTGGVKVIGDPLLCIVDCRPKASALANKAAGAGYESQNNYPNSQIYFNNIGNIHVMRDSYNNLCSLLLSPIPIMNDINFTKLVEDTNYLTNIRLILKCSLETVFMLKKNLPVLVHCSHGWDRTAQVTALTQLFLDPYYRTIDGFKILIEKEFLSFGHQFFLRCGHGLNNNNNNRNNYSNNNSNSSNSKGLNSNVKQEDQLSPIFFQFLDCTWQLLKQHIHFFEFNSRYLLTLADHIHSCRFGTFLFDSDLEREQFQPREACADIWTYLHYNRKVLTNPLYMDPLLEDTPTTHSLIPHLSQLLRNVTLWTDYFFRYCALPTIIAPPSQLSKHLYKSGVTIPSYEPEEINLTDSLFQPEKSHSSVGSLSLSHPPACSFQDFEVPAMVTSDDFWEAAVRREVGRTREVIRIEALTAVRGEKTVTHRAMPLKSLSPPSSSQHVGSDRGSPDASGEENDDDELVVVGDLDRVKKGGRDVAEKSIIEKQKVIINHLLALLRSQGIDSDGLDFCMESEPELNVVSIPDNDVCERSCCSSSSSSSSSGSNSERSLDSACEMDGNEEATASTTPKSNSEFACTNFSSSHHDQCHMDGSRGQKQNPADKVLIRTNSDSTAISEQSDCLALITKNDLVASLQCEDLTTLPMITKDKLVKLSSSDLLSALTTISPIGERKLFGSPKTSEDTEYFTDARIVKDEAAINEFY